MCMPIKSSGSAINESHRDSLLVSLHTHNDRGGAVAAGSLVCSQVLTA